MARNSLTAVAVVAATAPFATGFAPASAAPTWSTAVAAGSARFVGGNESLPCLVDEISPFDSDRQGERIRVGFGLSPFPAEDATEDFFGAQLSLTEYDQVMMQLEYQSQLSMKQGEIASLLGDDFGGAKICHARGGLVQIMVKANAADRNAEMASTANVDVLLRSSGLLQDVPIEIVPVEHSVSDLEALADLVRGVGVDYFRQTGSAVVKTQIDIENNQVAVVVDRGPVDEGVMASLLDEAVANEDSATFESRARQNFPLTLAAAERTASYEVNFEVMRAGNQIARAGQTAPSCTASVTLGFSGVPETLTSGHCLGWQALSSQQWQVVPLPGQSWAPFGSEQRNWFGSTSGHTDAATISVSKFKLNNCIQTTHGQGGMCKPAVGAKNAAVNGFVVMSGAESNVSTPLPVGYVTSGPASYAHIPLGEPDRTRCIFGWIPGASDLSGVR